MAHRVSADVDLFHDTAEALGATWESDRRMLLAAGYEVAIEVERPSFIRATVRQGAAAATLDWAQDSAYRFFPLVEHPDFGLTMHPFDLATNKVLAAVGRLEVRDWVDLIECDARLQPMGYLAWGAAGKDPGLTPKGIVEYAARIRYAAIEVEGLLWDGPAPDPGALSRRWKQMIAEAREVVSLLPCEEVGKAVLAADCELFCGSRAELAQALTANQLRYHAGAVRGAFPTPRFAS